MCTVTIYRVQLRILVIITVTSSAELLIEQSVTASEYRTINRTIYDSIRVLCLKLLCDDVTVVTTCQM